MIRNIILAVIIAIFLTIVLILVGNLMALIALPIAKVFGDWLKTYGAALGILAGLWFYFSRPKTV